VARSLTEVVAAGIKKLEPVEAADFGRVEIERPEHEARARLGPEERRRAGQPFATIDHVADPRGVGRIPEEVARSFGGLDLVVAVVVGISAIVFGVKGRKLAKAEASGRISATTGLVLGIVSVAIPILEVLAFINWLSCCLDNI
jgi:hypothetical protein